MSTWTLSTLHEATRMWLQTHDWLGGKCTPKQLDKWRFHEFAALWFPSAQASTVLHASLWSQLIAVLDDTCEEDRSTIPRLRALARGEKDPSGLLTTLAGAWVDLRSRIARNDEACAVYLDEAVGQMFDAYEWEHAWRERKTYPPYDEYDAWRWLSGGLKVYAVILAQHCELPIIRLRKPHTERLVCAAGTLACMANDASSAEWDRSQENPINAVCIAEAHEQKTFTQWQAEWHARLGSATPDPFRSGLDHFVSGTRQWMQLTGRYVPQTLIVSP